MPVRDAGGSPEVAAAHPQPLSQKHEGKEGMVGTGLVEVDRDTF